MLRLLLLRHAKSDWNDASQTDHQRVLSKRGKSAAPLMGRYIDHQGLTPQQVFVSSAARAQQTAELVIAQFHSKPQVQILDELYSFSSFHSPLNLIRDKGHSTSPLMIVAHNPTMEELAFELTGTGNIAARALMNEKYPTAALAVFDFDIPKWADLTTGIGTLISFTRPKDLVT